MSLVSAYPVLNREFSHAKANSVYLKTDHALKVAHDVKVSQFRVQQDVMRDVL